MVLDYDNLHHIDRQESIIDAVRKSMDEISADAIPHLLES